MHSRIYTKSYETKKESKNKQTKSSFVYQDRPTVHIEKNVYLFCNQGHVSITKVLIDIFSSHGPT